MNRTLVAVLGVIGLIAAGALVYFLVLRSESPVAVTPSPSVSLPASATPAATETEEPLDQELLARRVTFLVLGRDQNEARRERGDEDNTDSIIVASVNADHDEVAILSIPRDTVDIPLANGEIWPGKINAMFRELGHEELVGSVEALLGIEIDYYVQIDMDDMVRVVDAVGGVDVVSENALSDPGIDFFLEAGEHHLDGEQALSYTRTRQDGDHARSARQQEVLLELVRRLADPETDINAVELVGGLDSLVTDVPFDKIPTLLEIARLSEDAEVTRQVLAPPRFALFEGDEGTERGWVMIPNVDEMRAYAQEVMGD